MEKPKCPCWGCKNHTSICRRECEPFKNYEKAYMEFDKYRAREKAKKEATRYYSKRIESFNRKMLLDRKKGK